MKSRSFKFYLTALSLCLAIFIAYCTYQAQRPDRELRFVREVPTALPESTLQLSIEALANWPRWFYSLASARREDLLGREFPESNQVAEKGARIRLTIEPHRGQKRGRFELLTEVTGFNKDKFIELSVIEDRSGRMLKLFDRVIWRIDWEKPDTSATRTIRGMESAQTRHWKARVFSALCERILLNQIFYPDLMALGQFTQPQQPNPYPVYGQ